MSRRPASPKTFERKTLRKTAVSPLRLRLPATI
jgi:hypothetical protein